MFAISKKLLLVGVAGLVLSGCSLGSKQSQPAEQSNSTDKSTTLKAIFSGKESGVCVLTDVTKATDIKLEYTVKGQKIAMKTSSAGTKAGTADSNVAETTYMVNDGAVSYVWRDGQKTGTKISQVLRPTGTTGESETNSQVEAMAKNPDYQMDCKITPVADEAFAIPSDVTFTNLDKP